VRQLKKAWVLSVVLMFGAFGPQSKAGPSAVVSAPPVVGQRTDAQEVQRGLQAFRQMASTLGPAIHNLMGRFGPAYPRGGEFLERLDRLETLCNQATRDLEALSSGGESPAKIARRILSLLDELPALQREALIANPLVRDRPILYVVRHPYTFDHHNTHNFSPDAQHEFNQGHFKPGGALKMIDLGAGGRITTLLETSDGVIRDPRVHWDGERIVFSMRKNRADSYHIYEINRDGTGLKQLTHLADVDDIHPLYLPDDGIVFSSTREPKYCMCNRHIMGNLYRMESDGANIHQITKNTLFDRPTDIVPDGRILYDRWEYVDRNFGDAQSLWTVNPDGTNQAVYWGNNTPAPGAVLDARMIPGAQQALCILSSCHDLPWGALAIIDRRLGMDGREPIRRIWPQDALERVRDPGKANQAWDDFVRVHPKYENPHPLNESFFLVSRLIEGSGRPNDPSNRTGIYLLDVLGNELLLHAEPPGCFNPMPLAVRNRPSIIPPRRDFENKQGHLYVLDVYQGPYMSGVKRGAVKSLRVVESPEKRYWVPGQWDAQGQTHPGVNWHSFETKRILGTVPVEEDGSAYFSVPSDRFVYFQLLDEHGMMIQSMRSGTVVQSGETTGCVGCHDDRRTAPPAPRGSMPLAMRKPPVRLEGWRGDPRNFGYMAEVQPVFDRSCVACHDFGTPAGKKLNLAADRNLIFNASYNELWRKGYIKVTGGGPAEVQQAYSWGSHASPLVKVLLNTHGTHEKVTLTCEEFDRVVTWIDLNAVFYPDYSTSYPGHPGGRSPISAQEVNRLGQLTGRNLRSQFHHATNQGPLVSFDRPEISPVLESLTNPQTPEYREALEIVRAGAAHLACNPDVGMKGFGLSGIDLWREQKYQHRLKIELRYRQALRQGKKLYDGDMCQTSAPTSGH